MNAKMTNRLTRILDTATPALVVLAFVSFVLGFYCATQNLALDGLVCDANGFTFLIALAANRHSCNN